MTEKREENKGNPPVTGRARRGEGTGERKSRVCYGRGKKNKRVFSSAGYGRTHGYAGSHCINLGIRWGARIVFISHYASTPHQKLQRQRGTVHVAKNSFRDIDRQCGLLAYKVSPGFSRNGMAYARLGERMGMKQN
jgi:hypothetical protein